MFPWPALLGLGLQIYRLKPRRLLSKPSGPQYTWPLVSILVPARNEEARLGLLLESLTKLDYPNYEVIVVDDGSTDQTGEIARSFGRQVRLIEGRERPEGWFGKPWACQQAYEAAQGDYLLFTDADTRHHPDSLKRAMTLMLANQGDGFSTFPFHENPRLWEKLLGPFQALLLLLTAPRNRPKAGRVFAIGQYLLFERHAYEAQEGHQAIRAEAIDDLALAHRCLERGGRWLVDTEGQPYFSVRMYESLKDFIAGWRRNFRGSFRFNSRWSGLEVVLIFCAWTAALSQQDTASLTATGGSLFLLAHLQRRMGEYSIWGVLLFPLSMLLFTLITLLALWDMAWTKPLVWKGRSYQRAHLTGK